MMKKTTNSTYTILYIHYNSEVYRRMYMYYIYIHRYIYIYTSIELFQQNVMYRNGMNKFLSLMVR